MPDHSCVQLEWGDRARVGFQRASVFDQPLRTVRLRVAQYTEHRDARRQCEITASMPDLAQWIALLRVETMAKRRGHGAPIGFVV